MNILIQYGRYIVLCIATTGSCQQQLFELVNAPLNNKEMIITDPTELIRATQKMLPYFRPQGKIVRGPIFDSAVYASKPSYIRYVTHTLGKLQQSLKTHGLAALSPEYLAQHYHFIRWNGHHAPTLSKNEPLPEGKKNLPNGTILLTHYLAYRVPGSLTKTDQFDTPLYAIPEEERGISAQEIVQHKNRYLRFKFSREAIVNGVFERKKYRSRIAQLIWLTREAAEQAQLQGSVVVELPDNEARVYNVAKHNGFPYTRDKSAGPREQYWFFKEVARHKPYHGEFDSSIGVPRVTVAGDITNVGLGNVIALRYKNPKTKQLELRVCILADTGGAFRNNVHQLDYFAGVFDDHHQFKSYIKKIPSYVEAYILVHKQEPQQQPLLQARQEQGNNRH